jgi:hypothetical protein
MSLRERIEARNPQPKPETKRLPEWMRRAQENRLPAKVTVPA